MLSFLLHISKDRVCQAVAVSYVVQLPAVGSEVIHEAGNARSVQLAVFDQSLDVAVGHFSQANEEVEVEAASPLQELQSPFEIHLVLAEGA